MAILVPRVYRGFHDAWLDTYYAGIAPAQTDVSNTTDYGCFVEIEDGVVLIAGKGHEAYQHVGDRRVPYSDRETVRTVLEEAA